MAGVAFTKPALSTADHIALLVNRGLLISDRAKSEHYLNYIGYYRLSGYFQFFQSTPDHRFHSGVSFDDVLKLYIFDRELWLHVMDAVERIEVAVRTSISNTMSVKYGPHWYLDPRHFGNKAFHANFIQQVEEDTGFNAKPGSLKRQTMASCIKHYYGKYSSPSLPPSWMIAEVMSLGSWSKAFANLKNGLDQKSVCYPFGVNVDVFKSWLHAMTYLRNLCAHHSLLWNRVFTITPKTVVINGAFIKNNSRFYVMAALLHKMLTPIAPGSGWAMRLEQHFQAYPSVPMSEMGFPVGWKPWFAGS